MDAFGWGDTPLNPLSRGDFGSGDHLSGEPVPPRREDGSVSSGEPVKSSRREIIPYNPKLKERARYLRNNSTKSEIQLWIQLKGKFAGKYDFHRQKPLDDYIADFFCHELKLVIEIDGVTHNWEKTKKRDYKKECRLNELGLNVLRFTDDEVINDLDYTINTILEYIKGFEQNDLRTFRREDTPLNPLSRGDFGSGNPLS
jgi:very-short-patch-repair endonuclease